MPKKTITLPALYDLQQEVVDSTARFKVVAAGRRAGKTRMCSLIAIEKAFRGGRVFWVAPTYQVARIGWREATNIVTQFPMPINVKEGFLTIEFPSGGSIAFKSADSPDNLRGEGLDYLIVDEADFIKAEVWEQILRPSLSDRKGGAIFISTPKVEGGWFHRLFLKGQSGADPDIKSWHFSTYNNPFIDPKEIDKSKEELPSIVFRQEYLAEFVGATGARIRSEWLKFDDSMPGPGWKVALGVDLAISEKSSADYTAVAVLGRDPSGIVHILDIKRDRLSFAKQVEMIKSIADKWQPSVIGIEDVVYQKAMVQTISAQTSFVVRGLKSSKDKVSSFAPLEARYEQGQVVHVRTLPTWFEQELLAFPHGMHDDCVDACRLAFQALSANITQTSTIISPRVLEKTDGFKSIGRQKSKSIWDL
jgi:predicted phage terminase large subunit-like protein